jgi:Spy/CpxP family protein refolding chaperone
VAGRFRRWSVTGIVVLGLVICTPTPIESARWWFSPRVVAVLTLTPDQSRRIQHIYESHRRERYAAVARCEKAREDAERVMAVGLPDEDLERALSAYAEAEADRRKVRTLMLYRMWRVLSAQQRARLDEMFGERDR